MRREERYEIDRDKDIAKCQNEVEMGEGIGEFLLVGCSWCRLVGKVLKK